MTQKYHSAKDIDPEFIPSLEKLLSDCIPSFEWIKDYELNAPEDIHFTYYLFFGDKHNSPVGFAQILIENKMVKEFSFLSKLLKKTKNKIKNANWQMPGSLKEGVIFEPMYSKMAIDKTQNIFNEFTLRKDIQLQSLRFSKAYADLSDSIGFKSNSKKEKTIIDTLVKNQSNYEDYLNSQSKETQIKIKAGWKKVHIECLSLDEFSSFKEIFAYRKTGAKTYKELKTSHLIAPYLKENTLFLTLEKKGEILAIVFYIKGHGHHYFYDYFKLDSNIEDILLHQMAIMKFYEHEQSNRLHLLSQHIDKDLCASIGFTTREQIELSVIKKHS